MNKSFLLIVLLLLMVSSVSASDLETFVVYGGGDSQTNVVADTPDAMYWFSTTIHSSGSNHNSLPGIVFSGDYVIGDGVCSELSGESYVNSPVDCYPKVRTSFYEENTNLVWLVGFLILLLAYIYWSKKRGEY